MSNMIVIASLFGARSRVGRMAALLSLISLLAFFLGPFYWPGSGAAWAAFLRFSVFFSVVFYILYKVDFPDITSALALLLVFIAYMSINSILLEDGMQSLRRLVFIALFVFMVANFSSEPRLPFLLLVFVAVIGATFAGFSLVNLYRMEELTFMYRKGAVFSSGITGLADFGNTIVAAMHYAACYCAALWLYLGSKGRCLAVVWAACAMLTGLYIVMTFARTGWMACLIITFVLVLFSVRSRDWYRLTPMVLVIGALLVWFSYSHLAYEVTVRGVTYRDDIWASVLDKIKLKPFFGYGAGHDLGPISINEGAQVVGTAHSTYLEVAYQFGMIGFILMLCSIFLALKRLLSLSLQRAGMSFYSYGLAMLSAALIVMIVELNGFVSSPNLLWMWFWLPIGVALSRNRVIDC